MLSSRSLVSPYLSTHFFLIKLQLIYNIMLVSGVQHKDSLIHIEIFFFRMFYRLFKILSRGLSAVQQVLVGYPFYIQQCVSANLKLLIYPSPHPPPPPLPLVHAHTVIFFFFLLFRMAYGSSQTRGRIISTATGLHQSHSNASSRVHLRPTPKLMETLDP